MFRLAEPSFWTLKERHLPAQYKGLPVVGQPFGSGLQPSSPASQVVVRQNAWAAELRRRVARRATVATRLSRATRDLLEHHALHLTQRSFVESAYGRALRRRHLEGRRAGAEPTG